MNKRAKYHRYKERQRQRKERQSRSATETKRNCYKNRGKHRYRLNKETISTTSRKRDKPPEP